MDLSSLAKSDVVIAVPDATRPVDLEATLRPLLEALRGVEARAAIVVALGLHRPMTDAEMVPLATLARLFDVPLTQHDANREDFSPQLRGADAIVCLGVVEPHQYAGFSGGVKTVAIGCAPSQHISHMHRVELLRDHRVTLGSFHDNPFQQALWETASTLPPMWGLYQIPGAQKPGSIVFGPAREAMERAVATSRATHFEVIDEPVDWLLLQVPDVKATNLYQASRAATYAGLVEPSAVKKGGLLMVAAAAPEGMGDGAGEQACAAAMLRGRDVLLKELDSNRPIRNAGGAQRAYVIANTLRRYDIAFVGTTCGRIPALEAMEIPQFPNAESAQTHFGVGSSGRVISQPFHRVPIGRNA
jgi:nickel-dependent lactate racemase